MNETEARVRCLEMAERLHGRHGNTDVDVIVKTAKMLYAFANVAEKPREKPPLGLNKSEK